MKDWYANNAGVFHAKGTMDPSVGVTQDERLQRWLMVNDEVIARAVAMARCGVWRVDFPQKLERQLAIASSAAALLALYGS